MSVAGSPRRSPSCRWRKRHRPGADWWGPPVRFVVDQGCGHLFTCLGISLLVVVLWCVGNPDLWDRGLVCFWGTFLLWLVYPNLPIAWAQAQSQYMTLAIAIIIALLMLALRCCFGLIRLLAFCLQIAVVLGRCWGLRILRLPFVWVCNVWLSYFWQLGQTMRNFFRTQKSRVYPRCFLIF